MFMLYGIFEFQHFFLDGKWHVSLNGTSGGLAEKLLNSVVSLQNFKVKRAHHTSLSVRLSLCSSKFDN